MNFDSPELRDMPAEIGGGVTERRASLAGWGRRGNGAGGWRGANKNPKRRMFPGRAPRIQVCLERRKIRQSSLAR